MPTLGELLVFFILRSNKHEKVIQPHADEDEGRLTLWTLLSGGINL